MPDAVPRVALLVQGTEEYGVGQVALTLARGLREWGGEPVMIALESGALTEQCQSESIEYQLINLPEWPRFVRSKWKSAVAFGRQQMWLRHAAGILAAKVRELSCDVLVAQWQAHVALAGRASREAGVKCHWLMANVVGDTWPLGLNRRYFRHLVRRNQITVLPNSRYTANSLGLGADVTMLYLGVDETRFAPHRTDAIPRAELGLPADACVAGVFARIHPSKGQVEFWRAMIELIGEGVDLHLLLVGGPLDGPIVNQLRREAQARNFEERLHFVGWTDQPERYYDAIDLAVSPGLFAESFGLSAVESMLAGRPVLVHALGGTAETVLDGVTGWHVKAATVEAFAAGLHRALQDKSRWEEMGKSAREHALAHYSATAFVSSYLRIAVSDRFARGIS